MKHHEITRKKAVLDWNHFKKLFRMSTWRKKLSETSIFDKNVIFHEIKKIERELDDINKQLAERTDYESESYHQLMIDLNELQHQYEIHGGYNYQGETEKILQGLGFKREDFDKLTDTFSGGWRMRIELAKLLLQNW